MYDNPVRTTREEATESRFLLSCEHASNRVPDALEVTRRDRMLLDSHWGWDIGALNVAEEISQRLECPLAYSTYSRLLCDLNRHPSHENLFRTTIQDRAVPLNHKLSEEDKARRFALLHEPFHSRLDSVLTRHIEETPDVVMLSIHSFTPELDGQKRKADIGVVFDNWLEEARELKTVLRRETGLTVLLNEPYSGFQSYIYSMSSHGSRADIRSFQVEFKNSLIDSEFSSIEMARDVVRALRRLSWFGD